MHPPGEAESRGADLPIAFLAEPELDPTLKARALAMITDQAGRAPRPVLHARLSVRVHPDPALERPAVVKAMLDVSGRPVRARAAADSVENALDLIDERLRRNLEALEERRRAHRHETGTPAPGTWRHGDRATRPSSKPVSPGESDASSSGVAKG
jgi:ribosome-associated translation inhibitor RaiA